MSQSLPELESSITLGKSRCQLYYHREIAFYAESAASKLAMERMIDTIAHSPSKYTQSLWGVAKQGINQQKITLVGVHESRNPASVMKLMTDEYMITIRTDAAAAQLSSNLLHELSHFHPLGEIRLKIGKDALGMITVNGAEFNALSRQAQADVERLVTAFNKTLQNPLVKKFRDGGTLTKAQKTVCDYLFKGPFASEYVKKNQCLMEIFTHGAQAREQYPEAFAQIATDLNDLYEEIGNATQMLGQSQAASSSSSSSPHASIPFELNLKNRPVSHIRLGSTLVELSCNPVAKEAGKINEVIFKRGIFQKKIINGKTVLPHDEWVHYYLEGDHIKGRKVIYHNVGKPTSSSSAWKISTRTKINIIGHTLEALFILNDLLDQRRQQPNQSWRDSIMDVGGRHIPSILINFTVLPLYGFPAAFVANLMFVHMMNNVIRDPRICYKAAVLLSNDDKMKQLISKTADKPWALNEKETSTLYSALQERYRQVMGECVPDYNNPRFKILSDPKLVQNVVNNLASDGELKKLTGQLPRTVADLKKMTPAQTEQLAKELIERSQQVTNETIDKFDAEQSQKIMDIDFTPVTDLPISPFFKNYYEGCKVNTEAQTGLHFNQGEGKYYGVGRAASSDSSVSRESLPHEGASAFSDKDQLPQSPRVQQLADALRQIKNQVNDLSQGRLTQVPTLRVQNTSKQTVPSMSKMSSGKIIPPKFPHWTDKVTLGPISNASSKLKTKPITDMGIKIDTSPHGSVFIGGLKAGGAGFGVVGGISIELGADWLASLIAAAPGALAVGVAVGLVAFGIKVYQRRQFKERVEQIKRGNHSTNDVNTGKAIYNDLLKLAADARTSTDIKKAKEKYQELIGHCNYYIEKAKERRRNNGMSSAKTDQTKNDLRGLISEGHEINHFLDALSPCLNACLDTIAASISSQPDQLVKSLLTGYYHDRLIQGIQHHLSNDEFEAAKLMINREGPELDLDLKHLFLGAAESGLGNDAQAAIHFKQYLDNNSEDEGIAKSYICCLFNNNDYDCVIEFSKRQMANLSSDDAKIYAVFIDEATALKQLSDIANDSSLTTEQAIEKRNTEIKTVYAQRQVDLANAQDHMKLKQYDKAIELLLPYRTAAGSSEGGEAASVAASSSSSSAAKTLPAESDQHQQRDVDFVIELNLAQCFLATNQYEQAKESYQAMLNDPSMKDIDLTLSDEAKQQLNENQLQSFELKQSLMKHFDLAETLKAIDLINSDEKFNNKLLQRASALEKIKSIYNQDVVSLATARAYVDAHDYKSAHAQLAKLSTEEQNTASDLLNYQVAMGLGKFENARKFAQKIINSPEIKQAQEYQQKIIENPEFEATLSFDQAEALKLFRESAKLEHDADLAKFNDRVQAYSRVYSVALHIAVDHFDKKHEQIWSQVLLKVQRVCPTLVPVLLHSFQRMVQGERAFFVEGLVKSVMPFRKGYNNTQLDQVFAGIQLCVGLLHLVPSEAFNKDLVKFEQMLNVATQIKNVGQGLYQWRQLAAMDKLVPRNLKIGTIDAALRLSTIIMEKYWETQGEAVQSVSYYIVKDLTFTTLATLVFPWSGLFYVQHVYDLASGNYHETVHQNTLRNIAHAMEVDNIGKAIEKAHDVRLSLLGEDTVESPVRAADTPAIEQLKLACFNLGLTRLMQTQGEDLTDACTEIVTQTEVNLVTKRFTVKNVALEKSPTAVQFRLIALLTLKRAEQFHKEFSELFNYLKEKLTGIQRKTVIRGLIAQAVNAQTQSESSLMDDEQATINCLKNYFKEEGVLSSINGMTVVEMKLYLAILLNKCDQQQEAINVMASIPQEQLTIIHLSLWAQIYLSCNQVDKAYDCLQHAPMMGLDNTLLSFMAKYARQKLHDYHLALNYVMAIAHDERDANDWKLLIDLLDKVGKHYLGVRDGVKLINYLQLLCIEKMLECLLAKELDASESQALKASLQRRHELNENLTAFAEIKKLFDKGRLSYLIESFILPEDQFMWKEGRFKFNPSMFTTLDEQTVLVEALYKNDYGRLETLLSLPCNVNALINKPDLAGNNLLMQVIKWQDERALELILPYIDADTLTHRNEQGECALSLAFRLGHLNCSKQLLRHRAFNESMLLQPVANGNRVCHSLIFQDELICFLPSIRVDIKSLLSVRNKDGEPLLAIALLSEQDDAFNRLLVHAAEEELSIASENKMTILMWACELGLMPQLKKIMAHPCFSRRLLEQTDADNNNALLLCLINNNIDCFDLIIETNIGEVALNHLNNENKTILHIALEQGLVKSALEIIHHEQFTFLNSASEQHRKVIIDLAEKLDDEALMHALVPEPSANAFGMAM